MDSKEPEGKKAETDVFPGSASNLPEPFQIVANTNLDERPKGKVELDGLLRWEDEGGQIANRVNEGGSISTAGIRDQS